VLLLIPNRFAAARTVAPVAAMYSPISRTRKIISSFNKSSPNFGFYIDICGKIIKNTKKAVFRAKKLPALA
jgi:hypothetical protein